MTDTAPNTATCQSRRMARPSEPATIATDVDPAVADGDAIAADEAVADTPAASPPPATKAALVLALLRREEGATLAELVAVTGWLPHTTRAALTGLRKKGHAIAKSRRDDATCYRIVSEA